MSRSSVDRGASGRRWGRYALAAAMVATGAAHFVTPLPYVQHLPGWLPSRELVVYASGVVEVALGVALLVLPSHRRTVGRVLALFFIAVFPANIYVAVAGVEVQGLPGGAYPWIRLPFQLLFIGLALWSTDEDLFRRSRRSQDP